MSETKESCIEIREDFYNDNRIQWLKCQGEIGAVAVIAYIKLCLKGADNHGVVNRVENGEKLPWTPETLAEKLDMTIDCFPKAMELLVSAGLIKMHDSIDIIIPALNTPTEDERIRIAEE